VLICLRPIGDVNLFWTAVIQDIFFCLDEHKPPACHENLKHAQQISITTDLSKRL
jgi:hypothetical protein